MNENPSKPDFNANFANESMREFVRLYSAHTQHIYGYILCLVPNWSDAEDILQDTASIMWSKFDQFVPGTDFSRWGCRIARLVVANHYRKQKVRRQTVINSELLEAISQAAQNDQFFGKDYRVDALQQCLGKLRDRDQKLIRWRYEAGTSVRAMAERIDRSIDTIYKALGRIHSQLLGCIEDRLAREES